MVSIDTPTVVVVGIVVVAACAALYILNQKKSTTTQTTKSKNKKRNDKKADKKSERDTVNQASVSIIEPASSKNQKKNQKKKTTVPSAYETSKVSEKVQPEVLNVSSKSADSKVKFKPVPEPTYSSEDEAEVENSPEPIKQQPLPQVIQPKQVTPAPVLDEKDEEIRRLKEQLAALKLSADVQSTPAHKTQAKKKNEPSATQIPTANTEVDSTVHTPISSIDSALSSDFLPSDEEDQGEWTEIKKKKKKSKKTSEASSEALTAKSEYKIKETIMIPSDKRGIVMGRNAETLKKLLNETGAVIIVPKADAKSNEGSIEGTPEQVKLAKTAIKQLMDKGYATLFDPELSDGVAIVPVDKRSLVLGNNGANLRRIIDATGCKINFPERGSTSEKVQVVGSSESVREAVKTIKALVEDGFSPITHPGWVKVDSPFPAKYRRRLIGASGHLIKSIQNNSGCKITIPSTIDDVVYVTGPAEKIVSAEKQLNRLVAKIETPIEDVYQDGFGDDDVEEEEEW